jgi:dTDP-4-dehydrorhamnose 3,5-epimerase
MKLLEVETLKFKDIKVIKFVRFCDHRGYFTETYRKSDFEKSKETKFIKGIEFVQANESFSLKRTFRGLHFQWNPYMGKLVRPLYGHLIDFALDIRLGSPTFGKIIAYDMPVSPKDETSKWIWLPPGFAHGVLLIKDSLIEYFCSGAYNPNCEVGISPFAPDINWSLCNLKLKKLFNSIVPTTKLISAKDKNGMSVTQWKNDKRSENFIYKKLN